MKPKKDLVLGSDIELANRVRSRSKSRRKTDDEIKEARDRKAHREAIIKKELARDQDLRILREGRRKETTPSNLGDFI